MIEKISYIISTETDPYKNLALEEYLLDNVGSKECILYLWQNEKTVVIGKNQNPWKECKIAELEADGGKLVRRLSGGGAVFHDLGNLNFTFLVAKENYDLERQLEVILEAVKHLGIPAEKSGRNDICVEGKKFSGNAFYSDGFHSYHHGTILVHVDMAKLSHYLNVSRDKLVTKGVESVRSRVMNLTEYVPELTIDSMKEELIKAFGKVYGYEPERMSHELLTRGQLAQLEAKFASWKWIYGRKLEFNYSISRRFAWGDVDIHLELQAGRIRECKVYSDSLEVELFEELANHLRKCIFSSKEMSNALLGIATTDTTLPILSDVIELVNGENI